MSDTIQVDNAPMCPFCGGSLTLEEDAICDDCAYMSNRSSQFTTRSIPAAKQVLEAAGYACVPMVPDLDIIIATLRKEWPADWERGKTIQWTVAGGSDVIPFKTEYEEAAGHYQRILEVASKSTFQALPSISYVTSMEIADALISDFTDRRGFRQAWDNTDTTIREEIRQTWRKTMQRIVNASVEK